MTIEELSIKYFGTSDYNAALEVLAPSSLAVRQFKSEVEKLKQERK